MAFILRGVSYHRHMSPFPDTTLHRPITCLKGHQRIFQGSSGHPSCHLQAQGQPSITLPYAAGTLRHAAALAAPDTDTEAVPQPKEEAVWCRNRKREQGAEQGGSHRHGLPLAPLGWSTWTRSYHEPQEASLQAYDWTLPLPPCQVGITQVRKDPWDHRAQPMAKHHHVNQTTAPSAMYSRSLNTSRDGESIAIPGKSITILMLRLPLLWRNPSSPT